MRKLSVGLAMAAAGWLCGAAVMAADGGGSQITVEGANAVTFGKFTVEDATIKVEPTYFNPRAGAELRIGGTPFSIGGEYAHSENTFDGEYQDSEGSLDVTRTEYAAFVRWGNRNGSNLRVGLRGFDYELSDATITVRKLGLVEELDVNGTAKGNLGSGPDVELTLAAGDRVQFALMLGYTYFMNARYDWDFDQLVGPITGHVEGEAKLKAHSGRVRPELSVELVKNLRLFVNYTLSASYWSGSVEGEKPDYPGVDVYSAAGGGLRYTIPF